jgi:hypothetical protein
MIGNWKTPCDTGLQNGGKVVAVVTGLHTDDMDALCKSTSDHHKFVVDWRFYEGRMVAKTHGDIDIALTGLTMFHRNKPKHPISRNPEIIEPSSPNFADEKAINKWAKQVKLN